MYYCPRLDPSSFEHETLSDSDDNDDAELEDDNISEAEVGSEGEAGDDTLSPEAIIESVKNTLKSFHTNPNAGQYPLTCVRLHLPDHAESPEFDFSLLPDVPASARQFGADRLLEIDYAAYSRVASKLRKAAAREGWLGAADRRAASMDALPDYGYDDEDSFIDNSEAVVVTPKALHTKFGRFFVYDPLNAREGDHRAVPPDDPEENGEAEDEEEGDEEGGGGGQKRGGRSRASSGARPKQPGGISAQERNSVPPQVRAEINGIVRAWPAWFAAHGRKVCREMRVQLVKLAETCYKQYRSHTVPSVVLAWLSFELPLTPKTIRIHMRPLTDVPASAPRKVHAKKPQPGGAMARVSDVAMMSYQKVKKLLQDHAGEPEHLSIRDGMLRELEEAGNSPLLLDKMYLKYIAPSLGPDARPHAAPAQSPSSMLGAAAASDPAAPAASDPDAPAASVASESLLSDDGDSAASPIALSKPLSRLICPRLLPSPRSSSTPRSKSKSKSPALPDLDHVLLPEIKTKLEKIKALVDDWVQTNLETRRRTGEVISDPPAKPSRVFIPPLLKNELREIHEMQQRIFPPPLPSPSAVSPSPKNVSSHASRILFNHIASLWPPGWTTSKFLLNNVKPKPLPAASKAPQTAATPSPVSAAAPSPIPSFPFPSVRQLIPPAPPTAAPVTPQPIALALFNQPPSDEIEIFENNPLT